MNNVGTAIAKDATEFTEEDMKFLFGTNFESVYNLCQLAYPFLKASGNGSIVLISSIAGVTALRTAAIYSATKGSLI